MGVQLLLSCFCVKNEKTNIRKLMSQEYSHHSVSSQVQKRKKNKKQVNLTPVHILHKKILPANAKVRSIHIITIIKSKSQGHHKRCLICIEHKHGSCFDYIYFVAINCIHHLPMLVSHYTKSILLQSGINEIILMCPCFILIITKNGSFVLEHILNQKYKLK